MAPVVDEEPASSHLGNGGPSTTSSDAPTIATDLFQTPRTSQDEQPSDGEETFHDTFTSPTSITSPPYWHNSRGHQRSISNMSAESVLPAGAIAMRDNETSEHDDRNNACWAKSVEIADCTIVNSSATNIGAFVVWNIRVETLNGCYMNIRKRYSEFDEFRKRLVVTFPNFDAAVPVLPPKSVISKFRPRFLEKRRAGLQYFLNCILLNPEFSGSPVLKEFLARSSLPLGIKEPLVHEPRKQTIEPQPNLPRREGTDANDNALGGPPSAAEYVEFVRPLWPSRSGFYSHPAMRAVVINGSTSRQAGCCSASTSGRQLAALGRPFAQQGTYEAKRTLSPHEEYESKVLLFSSYQFPLRAAPSTTPLLRHPPERADFTMSPTRRSSSFSSNTSPTKSKAYMDSLVPPSADGFERIASVQQEREEEQKRKARELKRQSLKSQHQRKSSHSVGSVKERADAARVIQKTFRGYRTRREMQGYSLDAGARWVTAIREAQFREVTRPRARSTVDGTSLETLGAAAADGQRPMTARDNWRKVSTIARRAGHDDLLSDSSSVSSLDQDASPEEKAAARAHHEKAVAERKNAARMMGLQYFLEMVDIKHRYGSNLRMYHEEWKRSDTNENFFYWLDSGEGRNIELDTCPRDRLEREQVRYLSREERLHYLVEVDSEGRLCWAKNGERIDTTEQYKDSIHGIVPTEDSTPAFNAVAEPEHDLHSVNSSSSSSSDESTREADRAAKYASPAFDDSPGIKKVTHISASTIFNKLLRKSVKKNTWIFVADTSFRLYVGIKDSGAFQHSSFLQGSRISAAGLIKVKNGRLSSLSPLSGHYRPPASNFRAFVKSIKTSGVDTSRVSISKSYAVLVGLETYMKTRSKGKQMVGKLVHRRDRILAPEELRRREEAEKDKSQSAEKERRLLESQEVAREEDSTGARVMEKLGSRRVDALKLDRPRPARSPADGDSAGSPLNRKPARPNATGTQQLRCHREKEGPPADSIREQCQASLPLPMASVTRSTRRAEGLHPHQASAHLTSSAPGLFHQSQALSQHQGVARSKRTLDVVEHDFEAINPKRTRITVEILAKGNTGNTIASNTVKLAPTRPRPVPAPSVATVNHQQQTPPAAAAAAPPPAPIAATIDQNLTKHQAKVINGIKHELDRLQPQPKDTRDQGRKLRSQEATRFKSELSAYFPDYDEVIGNEPKEQHTLNVDTPIVIVDSDPRRAVSNAQRAALRPHHVNEYPVRGYGDALFNDVFDAQRIDFNFLEAQYKNKTLEDTLPDKLFQPVHRRAERLERSIRNTEKGRAQHEKDQIIRLLEGLQGHDWLRVMGVSGITETKKKTFEPARDHFIKGCQAIIAKFRNWSLEEKRRKQEKDKALAEKAEEEGDSDDDKSEAVKEEVDDEDNVDQDDRSDSASPAKQLHEEAMARSRASAKGSKRPRTTPQPAPPKPPKPPKPPEPQKEFKSFFTKKYERDSALNRHRRAGRKVMAWGHPIPDIPEMDFDLPEEYRDEEILTTRARKKRRERRISKE
ncbi:hypothetical protein G7046_g6914 [Stylonectria norvegica]|nr:hypothetical protein G7046_g6914 [Stylonectria norvegica]